MTGRKITHFFSIRYNVSGNGIELIDEKIGAEASKFLFNNDMQKDYLTILLNSNSLGSIIEYKPNPQRSFQYKITSGGDFSGITLKKETETKIIPMKNQQFNFVYDEVFGIDNPLVLKDVDKKIAEIHLGSPQFVCKIIRTNTNIQVCNHSIIYPNTIWALIDFIRLQWGRELVMETLPIK